MTDTTVPADYTPGVIPETDVRPPPSAWAAGDVHQTHDQIAEGTPGGAPGVPVDPRDAEILRLQAELAGRPPAETVTGDGQVAPVAPATPEGFNAAAPAE